MTPAHKRHGLGFQAVEWLALSALAVFTATAVTGYWIFALNPGLIPDSDFARTFYGLSFKLFARVHIGLSALVLMVKLYRHSDARWFLGLSSVALVSFLSEHIGTGYGFPFGGYEYTSLLGWKVGGRVPLLIPISWFLMALPSWFLARVIIPTPGRRLPRFLLGAYLLTAWDLSLDPAMSSLTPYWIWENPGPFYGMPWINLAGWMGTGLVLMAVLELLNVESWTAKLDARWVLVYYLVVLLMPAGMLASAGMWGAVLATAFALALPWGLFLLLRSPNPSATPRFLARERT